MLSQIVKNKCNSIQTNSSKKIKEKLSSLITEYETIVGQKSVCSKVLFVHSMKAYLEVGKRGNIAQLIINLGTRREWLVSHPCCLTPGGGGNRYHLIGVSGGPRAGLEILERR